MSATDPPDVPGLAIDLDLDGPTPNDPLDADTGPNGLQNFPTLTAVQSGAAARVTGSFAGAPDTTLLLDFDAGGPGTPAATSGRSR